MLLNAILGILYLLFVGGFRVLVVFLSLTTCTLTLFTVLGLFRLRSRSRSRPRFHSTALDPPGFPPGDPLLALQPHEPYRTHTAIPIVFCVAMGAVVLRAAAGHPWMVGGVLGVCGVGLGAWRWRMGRMKRDRGWEGV